MPLSLPGAPKPVVAALEALAEALQREAGSDFAGLVLYGGLARGRFRDGRSDVNVVVLLHRASADVLGRIGPALRVARRAAAVEAMLLRPSEVPASAFEFPTKFLDIKRHHIVLAGDDPFSALEVPRVMVQLRIAQSLRNLLLRMRRHYAVAYDDPQSLKEMLLDIARPLAIELLAMLYDGGHQVPESDQTAPVFAAAATAFELDGGSLATLAELRAQSSKDNGKVNATALYARILGLLAGLCERADGIAGVGN
jgi:predicted nucleotidyltransferase